MKTCILYKKGCVIKPTNSIFILLKFYYLSDLYYPSCCLIINNAFMKFIVEIFFLNFGCKPKSEKHKTNSKLVLFNKLAKENYDFVFFTATALADFSRGLIEHIVLVLYFCKCSIIS